MRLHQGEEEEEEEEEEDDNEKEEEEEERKKVGVLRLVNRCGYIGAREEKEDP